MDGDTTARVAYLGLLLLAVCGSLFTALRHQPGKTLQQVLIWALIFLGAIAVAGLWPDIRRQVLPSHPMPTGDGVELRAADDGHYYAEALVNGTNVRFVIDTGASQIVLNQRDARRIGLDPAALAYTGQATTANGTTLTAPIRLDTLVLGPYEDKNLAAVVNSGQLDTSLLGISYLGLYELTFTADKLTLKR